MRKNSIKYLWLLAIGLIIFLAGCSLGGQKKKSGNNDWKNEVLMAQSCGIDGLMCCPDKDPKCQFGQECCVDPNDDKRNYCSDKCDFGTEGSFCRAEGLKCDQGLVCNKGNCAPCGGENEPCCQSEGACAGELICHKDQCLKCGLPGNPCCGEEKKCFANTEFKSRLECLSDFCAFCGSAGGVACAKSPACDVGHLLNNGICLPCGDYNQPCCKNEEKIFCNQSDLECMAGFCANK